MPSSTEIIRKALEDDVEATKAFERLLDDVNRSTELMYWRTRCADTSAGSPCSERVMIKVCGLGHRVAV